MLSKKRPKLPSVFLGLTLGIPLLTQANTVSVDPASQTVNLGDVFAVDIVGSDFETPLDAGGIDIAFDSAIIAPASSAELPSGVSSNVTFASSWNTNFAPSLNGDTLEGAFFFADSAPSESFSILTVWFETVGLGNSSIEVTENALNPFAGNGTALDVEFVNGQVSAVPLPAAFWLLGSAFVGLAALSRRRAHR